jgi:hypothetical protein
MTFLLSMLRVALITHKTAAAIAATVVITAGTIEYLKKGKKK